MYKIKKDIPKEKLRDYGFMLGREWPGYRNIICELNYTEYFLFPMDPDEPEKVYLTDCERPHWSIHVQSDQYAAESEGRLWIDCVPDCTYHIDSLDMEQMFNVLFRMIKDGIIEDDYSKGEKREDQC